MTDVTQPDENAPNYDIDDVAYWLTRTVEERMQHLEYLRRKVYFEEQAKLGNYPTEMPPMEKVGRIIRLKDKK